MEVGLVDADQAAFQRLGGRAGASGWIRRAVRLAAAGRLPVRSEGEARVPEAVTLAREAGRQLQGVVRNAEQWAQAAPAVGLDAGLFAAAGRAAVALQGVAGKLSQGGSVAPRRPQRRRVPIRVTPAEADALWGLAAAAGVSVSRYGAAAGRALAREVAGARETALAATCRSVAAAASAFNYLMWDVHLVRKGFRPGERVTGERLVGVAGELSQALREVGDALGVKKAR